MKKVLVIFLLLVPAMALSDGRTRYAGLKLHKSNFAVHKAVNEIQNLGSEITASPIGFSLNYGTKHTRWTRLEGEFGYYGGIKQSVLPKGAILGGQDSLSVMSLMANGYFEYPLLPVVKSLLGLESAFWDRVYNYFGVGAGFGILPIKSSADIQRCTHIVRVDTSGNNNYCDEWATADYSAAKTGINLPWQVMVGLNIIITDKLDANLGYKIANYGAAAAEKDGTKWIFETKTKGVYLGAAWKF